MDGLILEVFGGKRWAVNDGDAGNFVLQVAMVDEK
jgi:hypothetical protein